ncbi:MAG: hydrogenase nickel incorporation protein HypB [Nevskia sp.]|nr:hydrogenase nickel incorporation protein HypB [Nevskia sp.]
MCDQCGCGATAQHDPGAAAGGLRFTPLRQQVDVVRGILDGNHRQAEHNRAHFDAHGIVAINLMSSPGSGKTALLEATIPRLRERYRIAVVEGDLETDNDARRIRAQGVPAVQITTGTACHLDAALVHDALHALDLDRIDLLFIENIGNLVCPASFGLGQHRDVTLLSVTEGDDKPAKYPVMFRASDLVLISKTDLLPHLPEFDPRRAQQALADIGARASSLCVSVRDPGSLDPWLHWLERTMAEVRSAQHGSEAGRGTGAGHAHAHRG